MARGTILLHPGRLLQVLIDIFRNAIKTHQRFFNSIDPNYLTISTTWPTHGLNDAAYIPLRKEGILENDKTRAADMADKAPDLVFLQFAIESRKKEHGWVYN